MPRGIPCNCGEGVACSPARAREQAQPSRRHSLATDRSKSSPNSSAQELHDDLEMIASDLGYKGEQIVAWSAEFEVRPGTPQAQLRWDRETVGEAGICCWPPVTRVHHGWVRPPLIAGKKRRAAACAPEVGVCHGACCCSALLVHPALGEPVASQLHAVPARAQRGITCNCLTCTQAWPLTLLVRLHALLSVRSRT